MAHLSPPFPELGQIETFTPPQLVPIGSRRHDSPWTAKTVVYRRSKRWQGSVVLRRFAPRQERIAAAERGQEASIFDPVLLNQLSDGFDTFDLQLPLPTVQFGDYAFNGVAAVDAARGQVKAEIDEAVGHEQWGLQRGIFVRMGIRYYQVAEVKKIAGGYELYFTPGVEPTDNTKMLSLLPSAADGAVPRIKARLASFSLAATQRRSGIEGTHSFQWQEALS